MVGLEPEVGTEYADSPPARPGTTLFLRGHVAQEAGGETRFESSGDQRSHVLSSIIPANAWLRVEAGRSLIYPKLPGHLSRP